MPRSRGFQVRKRGRPSVAPNATTQLHCASWKGIILKDTIVIACHTGEERNWITGGRERENPRREVSSSVANQTCCSLSSVVAPPHGFHNQLYKVPVDHSLSYGAHLWAYLLTTSTVPNGDIGASDHEGTGMWYSPTEKKFVLQWFIHMNLKIFISWIWGSHCMIGRIDSKSWRQLLSRGASSELESFSDTEKTE